MNEQNQHSYTTKNKHNFLYPKPRLTEYSWPRIVPNIWEMKFLNKLPQELTFSDDVKKFKGSFVG